MVGIADEPVAKRLLLRGQQGAAALAVILVDADGRRRLIGDGEAAGECHAVIQNVVAWPRQESNRIDGGQHPEGELGGAVRRLEDMGHLLDPAAGIEADREQHRRHGGGSYSCPGLQGWPRVSARQGKGDNAAGFGEVGGQVVDGHTGQGVSACLQGQGGLGAPEVGAVSMAGVTPLAQVAEAELEVDAAWGRGAGGGHEDQAGQVGCGYVGIGDHQGIPAEAGLPQHTLGLAGQLGDPE